MPTSTTAIPVQTVTTANVNADIKCALTETATGAIVDWYINEVSTGVDRLLIKEVKQLVADGGTGKVVTTTYYYDATAVNYASSTVPAAATTTGNAYRVSKAQSSDSVPVAAIIKAVTG